MGYCPRCDHYAILDVRRERGYEFSEPLCRECRDICIHEAEYERYRDENPDGVWTK